MADQIRYDLLTQQALRGVVRSVLAETAQKGAPPGEHHFFIAFDTRSEGVKLSQRMRTQYPEEMTVVLQHQFWDLVVTEEQFEVGLSFGGVPERVVVPFAAIKSFADPSVKFGVQFEMQPVTVDDETTSETAATAPATAALPTPANPAEAAEPDASNPATKPDGPPSPGAEVVRLDRFRKK